MYNTLFLLIPLPSLHGVDVKMSDFMVSEKGNKWQQNFLSPSEIGCSSE